MILLTILMNVYIMDYFTSMNIFILKFYIFYDIDSEKQKKLKYKFMIIHSFINIKLSFFFINK